MHSKVNNIFYIIIMFVFLTQVCVYLYGYSGSAAGFMPCPFPEPVCGELSEDGAKAFGEQ